MPNIQQSANGSDPAFNAAAITPSDSTAIAGPVRAIYVGVAGNLAVGLVDGTSVTFQNVPAGSFVPLRALKVLATGTTASGIVGLW